MCSSLRTARSASLVCSLESFYLQAGTDHDAGMGVSVSASRGAGDRAGTIARMCPALMFLVTTSHCSTQSPPRTRTFPRCGGPRNRLLFRSRSTPRDRVRGRGPGRSTNAPPRRGTDHAHLRFRNLLLCSCSSPRDRSRGMPISLRAGGQLTGGKARTSLKRYTRPGALFAGRSWQLVW